MNRHLLSLRAVSMTAMALLLAGVAIVQAQTGASQPQRPMVVDETQAASMMAERQKMMANMRAMDQKLNDLVAKMNSARGNDKVETIATLVKEMVAQRTQMHGEMSGMETRMMGHMMEHMMSMQGGMMGMMNNRGQAGAMQSMSNCPMMKELSKDAAEAEHHPQK
jgi:hypothetical protein